MISNRIRNAVRDYAYEHNYPFINLRTHEGMLRNMIVRTSTTGELMVILICKIEKDEEMELFKQLLQYVADTFPMMPTIPLGGNMKLRSSNKSLSPKAFATCLASITLLPRRGPLGMKISSFSSFSFTSSFSSL